MISRRVRICLCFLILLLVGGVVPIYGTDLTAELPFDVDALSAVLMDAETGEILYAKNPDEALPPASVTKIMTLLLVMEAIDSGQIQMSDTVSISENAASMGGSQVYLEPGEQMSVEDLLKSTVVSSANDAAVALGEFVAGSEEAFVRRMNERAAELGMEHTKFENATGLDDDTTAHLTSAEDIAIMSRELISHEKILEYTSIWMDTIRNGAFGLSNTNRLIRFYSGATGLKTGSTSKAKFCISATAKREGLHLIAVIMGSPTRDIRNAMATRLLDWGFANFAMYRNPGADAGRVKVLGGVAEDCGVMYGDYSRLMKKGSEKNVTYTVE
ncbi:MAG: D-alanyl-D-alanine carboxypeptidase, partial [Clostridia bacterium]|nr:D-alanyl-D-alanine carboxypeptidase [Clostridia bacterium]